MRVAIGLPISPTGRSRPRRPRGEPPSRKTRVILLSLAILLVVLEVGLQLLHPWLDLWMSQDSAWSDGTGETVVSSEPHERLGLFIGALLSAVLVAVLGFMPTGGAAVTQGLMILSVPGLIGQDHSLFSPY